MKWLGLAMLALIVLHHIWNHVWYKGFGQGRMSIYRAAQTLFDLPAFAFVIGSLFSGLVWSYPSWISSRWDGGTGPAHFTCPAPWSFLLIGLHRPIGAASWGRPATGLSGPVQSATAVLRLMGTALACCWPSSAAAFGLFASANPFSATRPDRGRVSADYFAIFLACLSDRPLQEETACGAVPPERRCPNDTTSHSNQHHLEGRAVQAYPESGGGEGGLCGSAPAAGNGPCGDRHDPLCGFPGGLGDVRTGGVLDYART